MYGQTYNPYIKNINTVKEYFRSPCVLINGCARALSCVLSVVAAILVSANMDKIFAYFREYILQIYEQFDAPADIKAQFLDVYDRISPSFTSPAGIAGSIPSALITALIAAAFIIIFIKSRNADGNSTPISGFTILHIFAVIELIVFILALLAVVAVIVFLFLFYSSYSSGFRSGASFFGELFNDLTKEIPFLSDVPAEAFLAAAIVLIIVLVFAAFYVLFTVINKIRYYKSVRLSLSSVELHQEGAKPYGVMCVINAVFLGGSLLSMPSMLFTGTINGKSNPLIGIIILQMLAQAASFVAAIMEAKLALGYKSYIDGIKYGYNTHAAPAAAPYEPFPAGVGVGARQAQQPRTHRYTDFAPTPAANADMADVQPKPETDNAYADPYGADAAQPDVVETTVEESPAESIPEPEAADVPTCPLCGAEVDPTAPFCGNCGRRLY